MREPIQQGYRQFLSGISKAQELRELPMYHCGDNTYLWNIADATEQDLYDLLQELGAPGKAADVRSFCGNLFCGIPSEREGYLYLYYYPSRREIRMVRCLEGRLLPGRLGEKEHYTGKKTLTQVCPDDKAANFGMCYILHLGEGHFIVYDGFGNNGNDDAVIYQQLLDQTPKGQQPVIDVWVMTHVHWDHIAGIHQFSKKYKDSVRVLNFVLNVPPFSNFMGKELRTAIRSLGISIMAEADNSTSGERTDGKKEIFVGKTNRAESAALSAELTEERYTVGMMNQKLVICAFRNAYLEDAVQYVTDTLFAGATSVSLDEHFRYNSESYPVLELVKEGKSNFTIIRAETAANYITDLALSVRSAVKEVTGVEIPVEFDLYTDPDAADAYEILIGSTNRKQSAQALDGISIDAYSVAVSGNRIIVNSHSLNGVIKGVEALNALLRQNADESRSLTLPVKQVMQLGQLDGILDAPAPDGLSVMGAYRGLDNTFERIWGGATEQSFSAYCQKLEQAGYVLYDENSIAQNRFAEYTKGTELVSVSFLPFDGSLRVISEKATSLLPLQAGSYDHVADPALMQMSFDDEAGNFGMGYVFTLEDGSYLIIDGGGRNTGDAERLFQYLQENNRRTDGRILIRAWILTHEHYDHVCGFQVFAQKYAGDVTLERLLWNMVPYYEAKEEAGFYYSQLQSAAQSFGNVEIIKVHAGQRAQFANAELEILFTPELLAPYQITEMNDTSLILRVKISGKTILFLADASTPTNGQQNTAVSLLYKMYGAELKADICQVGHHGWNGGSTDIYNAVAPEIILWPVEGSRWETVCQYPTSKQLLKMVEEGSIKQMYVAKDGQVVLPLGTA